VGQGIGENVALIRGLAARLEAVQYELGRAEARLELTAQAEITLQEALERERERAERLEADREQLLPDLLREKDRANAERERAEHFEAQLRKALEARRGWFRRFFGF
jgi:chromosome segregation ATPase